LELAVLGPAVLALTFVVVQAALYFYARSLALAAAREGVAAARSYAAAPDVGRRRAEGFLAAHAGDSLLDARVDLAGSTATVVRIAVTGRALSVLPGGVPSLAIRQVAQADRERFTIEATP
jgi:hypothetical protein